MPLYEPPPVAPNWLFRLAHMTLAAAMLAGLMAALYALAFIIHAMAGVL
jgi:hypothetical protein